MVIGVVWKAQHCWQALIWSYDGGCFSDISSALPTLPICLLWHALLVVHMVIIGGCVAFLVCNMAILRLRGSQKVIILALEGAMAYASPTRLPLLHRGQRKHEKEGVQSGATHLVH